jgi:hypothetical protein
LIEIVSKEYTGLGVTGLQGSRIVRTGEDILTAGLSRSANDIFVGGHTVEDESVMYITDLTMERAFWQMRTELH